MSDLVGIGDKGDALGRMLRFGLTGRGRLVGIVFFLAIVAAALGGCGDDASSPLEEGERERGVEEVVEPEPVEPREEPKPPETKAEAPRKEAEAAPPVPAPEPERPAPAVAASDQDGGVQYESGTHDTYYASATVTRVVDGDTIEISPALDGITDVRLIGVDTPETKEPGCAPQPYGAEAGSYAESVLSGQEVGLELGVEGTDRYGRLLAYVYTQDGEMFNEDLVEGGYAQAYPYPPNTKYADRFAVAQEQARGAGLGIWSMGPDQLALLTDRGNGIGAEGCTPLSPEPEPVPQYQAPAAPAPVPYPDVPSVPSATSAGGDLDCKDFGSLAEVQASIAAGDPHGLDADGDGSGCESQF